MFVRGNGLDHNQIHPHAVAISTSAQNVLDNFAYASILWTLSMIVRFILSASLLSSGIFGTVSRFSVWNHEGLGLGSGEEMGA